MRVPHQELPRRLGNDPLPRVVLLYGEEPLLIEESARRLRHAARKQGFNDRIPLSVEANFDWGRLAGSSQTLSLFAERRLIELRMPGKPGEAGTKAFAEYCEAADGDVLLMVLTGRLDARTRQAKWVKTLDQSGWVIEHKALKSGEFQNWLNGRLRDKGLVLDKESVQRMCHLLEGNLLAAAQEVDRLALFAGEDGRVDPDAAFQGLADNARFNVFELSNACVAGDGAKALRILSVLRKEGTEPVLVTWQLSRELHTLVRLEHGLRSGANKGELFKRNNVWSSRQAVVNTAIARLGERGLQEALRQLARCDRVLKGRESGGAWQALDVLVLMMCDSRYAERNPAVCHAES
jgi:DNA polymerase-3 subunit delta